MIENLINLIKENAGDLIVNNQAINNEHNDAAISETGSAIINGLKSEVSKGNIAGLTDILKSNGNLSNNPIVSGIISNLGTTLASKFNVNSVDAGNIAQSLIPQVMDQLISKTNDPNDDSFNVQGLLSNLGGSGLSGMLVNMFGSNKNEGESGGLGGMLKNFLS
ncbi:MAG: hypothetical protein ACOYMA_10715 [Bacteroidia bacterium]